MILSKITGLGKQTIEALKAAVLSHRVYIEDVFNNTGAIDRPFTKIVVTADGTGNVLSAAIPDGTKELFCQLEVEAGATTSAGQIRIGDNVLMASVASVVITTDKHVWAPRIASFTDGEKTYRYLEVGAPSVPSVANATMQGATRYVDVDEIGTISFILSTANVNYTEGDTLTIFYR